MYVYDIIITVYPFLTGKTQKGGRNLRRRDLSPTMDRRAADVVSTEHINKITVYK